MSCLAWRTAGKKRVHMPSIRKRPLSLAAVTISSASLSVRAMGFSTCADKPCRGLQGCAARESLLRVGAAHHDVLALLEEGDGVVLVVGVERADVAHVHLAAALAGSTMARWLLDERRESALRSVLAGVAAHVIAGRERAGAATQRMRDVEPLRKLRRRRELPRGNGAKSRR